MVGISNEELAALDQVAWGLTKEVAASFGEGSSDLDETIGIFIDHFMDIRGRLIDVVLEDNKSRSERAGTWTRPSGK